MEPQSILQLLDKTKEDRERWRISFAMNPSILVPRGTNLWERSYLESDILEDEICLLANKKRTTNKREKGGARRYWIRYPLKRNSRNVDQ